MLIIQEKLMVHMNIHQVYSKYTKEYFFFFSNKLKKKKRYELSFQFHNDILVDIELNEILEIVLRISIQNSNLHTFHQFYNQDEHHRLKLHLNLKNKIPNLNKQMKD